uniref:IRG-type G domain-containing protein n=1 Tax=Plectus sambesii TaxID=2011161 RepID=A0A914XCI9_9BILA
MGQVVAACKTIVTVLNAVGEVLTTAKPIIELFTEPASLPAPMPDRILKQTAQTTPELLNYSSRPPAFWKEQRNAAHRQLGIDTIHEFNIGFCGRVKAGKSTLINALRGTRKGDKGWAPTGSFEATQRIQSYRFNGDACKFGVLWDIPGCGSGSVANATYFVEQKLFAFDFLIIISENHFGEAEKALAQEARNFGVPFAYVRSKCDNDLRSIAEEERIDLLTDEHRRTFLENEKSVFKRNFNDDINNAPHFLISSP